MARFKRLLNPSEEVTYKRLAKTCMRNQAKVFAKTRVADVLPVEGSGISDDLFGFSLRSHFDFLVTDSGLDPLFAVEFDGAGHQEANQKARDDRKNALCDHFKFPLLRINSKYVNRIYRQLDLLTWFVECWFMQQGIHEAYESGHIPMDDYVDSLSVISIEGIEGRFPLWLSAEPLTIIRKLAERGKCMDYCPSYMIGFNEEGDFHAIGHMAIDDKRGVVTTTAMRRQRFPISEGDALHEIIMFEVCDLLVETLRGEAPGVALAEIERRVAAFTNDVTLVSSGGVVRKTTGGTDGRA